MYKYYFRTFANMNITAAQGFHTLEDAMMFAYEFLKNLHLEQYISKFMVYPNFNHEGSRIFFKRIYVKIDVPNIVIIITRISRGEDIDFDKVQDLGRRLLENELFK